MGELLTKLLADMDIPEARRDVSKESNLLWLLRNLAIRNSDKEHFALANELIINLLKHKG